MIGPTNNVKQMKVIELKKKLKDAKKQRNSKLNGLKNEMKQARAQRTAALTRVMTA